MTQSVEQLESKEQILKKLNEELSDLKSFIKNIGEKSVPEKGNEKVQIEKKVVVINDK